MSSSFARYRPGHLALGASLALLAHAAFSAVHFSALAAGRYGEAARALRVLPRDVLAELALALALALASVLLFSDALLPLDGGGEAPLNSLHRLLAPRADFAPAGALSATAQPEARAGAEKLLAEELRERRAKAKAKAIEAAREAAEARDGDGAEVASQRAPARQSAAATAAATDEEEEEEEEEEGDADGVDEAPEDVD